MSSYPQDPNGQPPPPPPPPHTPAGGYYAGPPGYGQAPPPGSYPAPGAPGSSGYYPPAGAPPGYAPGGYQTPQPMYPSSGFYAQPGAAAYGAPGAAGYGAAAAGAAAYAGGPQAYAVQTPPGGISQGMRTVAERSAAGPRTPTSGVVSQSSATYAEGAPGAGDPPNVHALIGRTIDRYKIHKLLGEGGFGAVYKAEHTLMKRDVAFKTLHKELARVPAVLHRFKKEGQVAARFRHKNAIELYDFGQMDDGTYFMAMEFLPGRDLRDHLKKKGALELADTFDIMIQSLSALQAAHDGGVIHRDLKPDNIKLEEREERDNFVKILDFGIAKIKDAEAHLDQQTGSMTSDEAKRLLEEAKRLGPVGDEPPESASSYKTQVGAFFGTPEYGSPEQCAGEDIDARSDLYTMGVILYECLTGSLPFVSKTPQGYLAQHMVAPPRPIRDVRPDLQIPPEVEGLILKALEKKREDRFQSGNEFAEAMIDVAHKCGIAITVEAGGTVIVKTPLWKWIVGIAAPVMIIVGPVVYWAMTRVDTTWETEKEIVAGFVSKSDYEELLEHLDSRIDSGVKERHPDWIQEQVNQANAWRKARDDNADVFFKNDLKKLYDDVPVPDRDYDKAIEVLTRTREDADFKAHDPIVSRFNEKLVKVRDDRKVDATAVWTDLEKEVARLAAIGQFQIARERCRPASKGGAYPDKFEAELGELAKARVELLDRDEKRVGPETIRGAAALNNAHDYASKNPEDYPGQLRQYEAVAQEFSGVPPGVQARNEIIPAVRAKFEAAAETAFMPVRAARDLALQKPELDALNAAFDAYDRYPVRFRSDTKAGVEWLAMREPLLKKAQEKTKKVLLEADDLREQKFDPRAAAELVGPWTKFAHDDVVRSQAERVMKSLDLILPLHETEGPRAFMKLVPTADVQIGEPNAATFGPIQPKRTIAGFYMDVAETTNAEYAVYLQDRFADQPEKLAERTPGHWKGTVPGTPPEAILKHPVRMVSVDEAKEYAAWAGKRLPDEWEWEYGARGPEVFETADVVFRFPWGANTPGSKEWSTYCRIKTERDPIPTAEVKTHVAGKSRVFGFFDMAGNVAEWTSSTYLKYEGSEAKDNYGAGRVVARGGSFRQTTIVGVRCASRYAFRVGEKPPDVGFRCVKPAPGK